MIFKIIKFLQEIIQIVPFKDSLIQIFRFLYEINYIKMKNCLSWSFCQLSWNWILWHDWVCANGSHIWLSMHAYNMLMTFLIPKRSKYSTMHKLRLIHREPQHWILCCKFVYLLFFLSQFNAALVSQLLLVYAHPYSAKLSFLVFIVFILI